MGSVNREMRIIKKGTKNARDEKYYNRNEDCLDGLINRLRRGSLSQSIYQCNPPKWKSKDNSDLKKKPTQQNRITKDCGTTTKGAIYV